MTSMLADSLTKHLPISVSRTSYLYGIVRSLNSLCWWELCLFMYFVRKAHVFSFVHAHLDVFHYLVILYH